MAKPVLDQGERHSLQFGGRPIDFDLVWRSRAHLSIDVHPDRTVVVIAPEMHSLEKVLERVRKRAGWIVKQLDYFQRFEPLPTPRQYVPGETHLYLGRQYRLKVTKSSRNEVKLLGRFVHVSSTQPSDADHTKDLVLGWYRLHAQAMFERRLSLCLEGARSLDVASPKLVVRLMRTRWGSCSKRGTILLNTELIKAPVDCIDYVITHELCHLKIHEHTLAFYRLLTRCMPDWERRKERLEGIAQ